ncbi:MAG: SAF domain-containing protein [Bacillota bacterium]
MTRKKGIFLSALLTILFTALIVVGANSKNMSKKTEVLVAKRTLNFGSAITEKDYEKIKIPEELAKGMVSNPEELKGKTLILPVGKGHYIYKDSLRNGAPLRPGFSEVFIEVDLAKSALALPGEYVDLVPIDNSYENLQKEAICKAVRVLHAVDSRGWDIDPLMTDEGAGKGLKAGDKKFPVTVGIEIPESLVTAVVPYADKKIQLVKGRQPEVQ